MIELVRTDDPVFLSWLTARLAGEDVAAVVFDSHTSTIYGGALDTLTRRVMVAEEDAVRARVILAEGRGIARRG